METPTPIHPFDLYDLVNHFAIDDLYDLVNHFAIDDLHNIEHKEGPNGKNGPSIVKVYDTWYIEDAGVPYKGSNPEFLKVLAEIKEANKSWENIS